MRRRKMPTPAILMTLMMHVNECTSVYLLYEYEMCDKIDIDSFAITSYV